MRSMRMMCCFTTTSASRSIRKRHAVTLQSHPSRSRSPLVYVGTIFLLLLLWCALSVPSSVTACPYLLRQEGQQQQQQRRRLQQDTDNDNNNNNNEVVVLLDARFDTSRHGFDYSDNLFSPSRGADNEDNGAYARGTWRSASDSDSDEQAGGFLQVQLGGRDGRDVENVSGGWERAFRVQQSSSGKRSRVAVELVVQLELAGSYESDEFARALCSVDGELLLGEGGALLELRGNNDGSSSSSQTVGFETITINLGDNDLDAGRSHTIAVGGFNNKKTSESEQAFVRFARVSITQEVSLDDVVDGKNDEDDEDDEDDEETTEREEEEHDEPQEAPDRAAIAEALSDARRDIRKLLADDDDAGDLIAKFVRLSFHDCLGGMCDGCVNTRNPSNRGLDRPIFVLQPVVDDYADWLTRGDVWVLAALVALEEAQSDQSFDMEWVGRPNCGGDALPNRGPDGPPFSSHFATAELLDFMDEQFDMSARDTVAIMGAHSLGRAVLENSGFDGRAGWDDDLDRLNNNYYDILLSRNGIRPEFRQELQNNRDNPTFPDQFLWRFGELDLFMLNADLALAVDLEDFIDPDDGLVTCSLSGGGSTDGDVCPAASTLDIALEFASSNSRWINDFHSAFLKMTSVGCNSDVCIEL